MRLLLVIFTVLILSATFSLSVARAIGSTQTLDPQSFAAMLAADTKLVDGYWCWHGICPGKTTLTEAVAILRPNFTVDFSEDHFISFRSRENPYLGSLSDYKESGRVDILNLELRDFQLNHSFVLFGSPVLVNVFPGRHRLILFSETNMGIQTDRARGRVHSYLRFIRLTLYSPTLDAELKSAFRRHSQSRWRGMSAYFEYY